MFFASILHAAQGLNPNPPSLLLNEFCAYVNRYYLLSLNLKKPKFASAYIFYKKWANPGLFFIYFWSFQTNNTIFYNKSMRKMSCPSSIRHWDSNPRPSERESPPITTRPGLPPNASAYFGGSVQRIMEVSCTVILPPMVCCL